MDVRKIYEYALQREHEGKNFFESNAERMSHAAAKGIFHTLAAEEQKHIEFIESLLEAFDSGGEADAAIAAELEKKGDFFLERARSEMLDQTVMESMVPDLPILRMAYLIEHDFSEFYEMAASKTEGDAREALTMLARWERVHEQLFKMLHDEIFEEYAAMPWGG
jgi:rubrerythrin